jgi:hypothetical protein
MAHDVYVSHAAADRQVAGAICVALENAGITCWIAPRDVPAGSLFDDAIADAITSSRVVVLVFSEDTNRSEYVRREVALAAEAGAVVLPVRVANVTPSGAMRYYLAQVHWIDVFQSFDRGLPAITDAVKRVLQGPEMHLPALGPSAPVAQSAPPRPVSTPAPEGLRPKPSSKIAPSQARSNRPMPARAASFSRAIWGAIITFLGTIAILVGIGNTNIFAVAWSAVDWSAAFRIAAAILTSFVVLIFAIFSRLIFAKMASARPLRGIWRSLIDRLRWRPAKNAPHLEEERVRKEAGSIKEAIGRLGVNHLEQLARLWLTPTSLARLPKGVADVAPQLDAIIRQADQILALNDPGRRLEASEEALRRVSALQSALLDDDHLAARELSGVVAGWSKLFIVERDKAKAEVEDAQEIENPFIFGNPVRAGQEGLFIGRRDVVLEIERNILRSAQTPTLLLYGQRRMGKTSILNQLPALLGPGFLPVIVDCQWPQTVESERALIRFLTGALSTALNNRLRIPIDHEEAQRARGSTPLPIEALADDVYSTLGDWLDRFEARLPPDTRLLLCLDEFERLNVAVAEGWGARFLDAMRHWVQHRERFSLMFIGSHTFEQLGPMWTDRFLSTRRLKVTFLAADDVRQLLTQPTPTFKLRYAPHALDAIVAATRGQPFLTQALAFELVQRINRAGKTEATVADVDSSIDATLDTIADYFADLWSSRSDEERSVLRDVATHGPRPLTDAVTRALRDYDVLDDNGEFAVPLIKRWVQQNETPVRLPA